MIRPIQDLQPPLVAETLLTLKDFMARVDPTHAGPPQVEETQRDLGQVEEAQRDLGQVCKRQRGEEAQRDLGQVCKHQRVSTFVLINR